MTSHCVAIVSQPDDLLSDALVCQLSSHGIPTIQTAPGALGDLSLRLQDETFSLDGQSVGVIFFHARPEENLSSSFQEADRSFVDAEIRAAWLAAMQLDSVLAINRYDANSWFENLRWTAWRRTLAASGVSLAKVHYGDGNGQDEDNWLPYAFYTPQKTLDRSAMRLLGSAAVQDPLCQYHRFSCGEAITAYPPQSAQEAAQALLLFDIHLTEIATDAQERVVLANPIPLITDRQEIAAITERLIGLIDAHLHPR